MSEDHLEENIVCGGCVEGCSIASPITLHVIDLDAVAIVALQDMIVMVKGMMTLVVVNYEGCHLVVGEKRVPVFINAEVHNIAPLYFDIKALIHSFQSKQHFVCINTPALAFPFNIKDSNHPFPYIFPYLLFMFRHWCLSSQMPRHVWQPASLE